jgi:hypothetical protein
MANKIVTMNLGSESNYFFTDTISGCQFMAYGNDRHNLAVSHSNALTIGGMTVYSSQAKLIRSLHYPITIIYGPQNYRAGLRQGEVEGGVTATIIGWRLGDGWHFYARRRYDSPTMQVIHRPLDNKAHEI